ncbi:hypothetical protein PC9H_004353 [Pleurotus ostreatus]|uniref:Uncharacterized protein n=1 Tax=Pleurotus ostreatus TaxID=5322 RepID=A0A8H7DYV2_PLEOS|nr:uncharacterized protein PC9H_004353 [Pleurotus ostreatus]KAF7437511.1 hypothetical protein PC9H_004353 [Pleurotus ostreatus]
MSDPAPHVPVYTNVANDKSTFNNVKGSQFVNHVTGECLRLQNIEPTERPSDVVDLEGIRRHVEESSRVVQDLREKAKDRDTHSHLSVYRALSVHPALSAMQPPTDILGDLDWYQELNSSLPSFGGIFKSLKQNSHFKRASTLGEEGTRARIMLLLLWVVGHRLPLDKVRQLVSTAIDNGMSVLRSRAKGNGEPLLGLYQVQGVVEQLARMIKTRLPLGKESNPFYGHDFTADDEDKAMPRDELWVYDDTPGKGLPATMRYEFDVKRNPVVLLRPLQDRVLVPQTKLSLLMIQWLTRNFGLGKKVFSPFEIDTQAFWNADPPSPNTVASGSEFDMDALDVDEPQTIFDAFQDLPLEEWVHLRFCRSYHVHHWAHDIFVRTILFSAYCGRCALPSSHEISQSIATAAYFRTRLLQDIVDEIQMHLMIGGMEIWTDVGGEKWEEPFRDMTKEDRGLMAIFSDVANEFLLPTISLPKGPPAFMEVFSFLIDPALDCPGEPDIVEITRYLEEGAVSSPENVEDGGGAFQIPILDPTTCSCSRCVSVHNQITAEHMENSQMKYIAWMNDEKGRDGCDALADAWEPVVQAAEEWVDEHILEKVESPLGIFPYSPDRRLGIAIVHVLANMELKLNTLLRGVDLLRFVTDLRYSHIHPDSFLGKKGSLDNEAELLGFVIPAEDNADYATEPSYYTDDSDDEFEVDQGQATLCVSGGWLYNLASSQRDEVDVVHVIPESRSLRIQILSTIYPAPRAVHMPRMMAVPPVIIPHSHMLLDAPDTPDTSLPVAIAACDPIVSIELSDIAAHGFPAVKAAGSEPGNEIHREGYSAQMSVIYQNRLFRTWWRPDVVVGQPCTHKAEYHRMTCCSMTSNQILLQVPPMNCCPPLPVNKSDYPAPGIFLDSPDDSAVRKQYDEYQKFATSRLTERDGALEAGHMCIVRCSESGSEDSEGPADPLIILAASLRLRVYIVSTRECCLCACERMRVQNCSVGMVMVSSHRESRAVTKCGHCIFADERADQIIKRYTD